MSNNNYDSSSIEVLEQLEAVRKRPGMYIGNVNSQGLHHLIWEILDNAIDEVLAGYGEEINIILHADDSISVRDRGRGIPVEIHPKTGVTTLETIFTVLHAGGKFGGENSGYKVSGGLHGVGASVTNALSSYLKVEVYKNGKKYKQDFKNGGSVRGSLEECGPTTETGTLVTFKPDDKIFESTKFDDAQIISKIKQTAYLNKNVKLTFHSELTGSNAEFKFSGGIVDFVEEINEHKNKIHDEIIYNESFSPDHNVEIEVALQYTTAIAPNILSFVNNIRTIEGGTHEQGFLDACLRIFNNYVKSNPKLQKMMSDTIKKEDIKEGLTAIISIKHPDPMFEGQTKGKLGNSEVRKIVNDTISVNLQEYLLENPPEALNIIEKIVISSNARVAARKARENVRRKDSLNSTTLPGKLADCSSKDPMTSELFIVEGDSAGGSAKLGRNRENQAILPLRGKVINAEKNRLERLLENNEITSIINAVGTGISDFFDISKLRYGKIILMTDADVDGAHIRVLLLTFFFRYLPELISNGNIYIAQPPLFKLHKGKEEYYAYSDEERDEILSKNPNKNLETQRYKGLGEMDYSQLWETTMDPSVRSMLRVEVQDAIAADEYFTILMGDAVEGRKKFIEENSKNVENLDI